MKVAEIHEQLPSPECELMGGGLKKESGILKQEDNPGKSKE